ncbi:MAG TPA: ATPase domain-containing protein [Bryobacteraceae bacterium]|nr:ATPase domain-containing protein [Bryobacteraceae bacterium]
MSSFPADYRERIETPAAGAISTGIATLDDMLGTGGLPRGRVVEIFGPPDCGKSTLALNWIAAAQTSGAAAVYVDAERSFDHEWAAACGVNLEQLVLLSPDSGSLALVMLESLLRTFTVDLVVVDSAAALISQEELETSLEDMPPELQTEFLSRALRRLQSLAERGRVSLLFLNQTRTWDRGGVMESAAGGRALILYSAIRISVARTGSQLLLTTVKNKLGEPFRELTLELHGPKALAAERRRPRS